ncbi:MAG: hypothetical protein ACOY45_14060 [Pseudomonadota bacterium]
MSDSDVRSLSTRRLRDQARMLDDQRRDLAGDIERLTGEAARAEDKARGDVAIFSGATLVSVVAFASSAITPFGIALGLLTAGFAYLSGKSCFETAAGCGDTAGALRTKTERHDAIVARLNAISDELARRKR